MIERGFRRLPLIQMAIRELYRKLSAETIRTFETNYFATRDERPTGDSIIATQHIARRLALLYRLRINSVVVTFISNLPGPGHIELSDSDDFFVELNADYIRTYEKVAAILAHEVAHIFLHRLKISIGGTYENEVLTDTTAVYLGAGVPILNAFREESAYTPETPNLKRQQYFGYISPDEFGYILAKRHAVFGDDPLPFLTSQLAIEAYKVGLERSKQDFLSPPLSTASIGARAAYRLKRGISNIAKRRSAVTGGPSPLGNEYGFENSAVMFGCPTCFQRLRLPVGKALLAAKCPNCKARFSCST